MTRTPRQHALLDLQMRQRLVALVRAYPGLHIREAARQLDTSMALVEYHVQLLNEAGLLRIDKDDRYVRLYVDGPKQPDPAERALLALLRERLPLQVTLYLLDRGEPARHGEIAAALDIAKSKLSFHLRKLEAAGVVGKTTEGAFQVANPRAIQRLLAEFPPTTSLRNEFAKLWLSLYKPN